MDEDSGLNPPAGDEPVQSSILCASAVLRILFSNGIRHLRCMTKEQKLKEQLGMPYGTAFNRLRKQIMFELVCKLGKNQCFGCGSSIESSDDFSIEHKLPWFGNDVALFWDLDNIAFSHTKCNRPHSYSGTPSKRRGPNDTWYCVECQTFKDSSKFSLYSCGAKKDGTSYRVPRKYCKVCRRNRQKLFGKNAI